jgi:hypothetical protein
MQVARRKLGKKTHPNHGGHHCLMGAMVPSPRHCRIEQLANMLRKKSMPLKLENIIVFYNVFIIHFKARRIINVPCLSVCGLRGAESCIILSAGGAETIILSAGGAESMMLSVCAESMIVSALPAQSMILSGPCDCFITLLQYHAKSSAVGGNKKKQSAILKIAD